MEGDELHIATVLSIWKIISRNFEEKFQTVQTGSVKKIFPLAARSGEISRYQANLVIFAIKTTAKHHGHISL